MRDRASELRDVQRAALDAAFGLTREAAPEHFRIAMAALDLVSDVAGEAPVLLVVEDAHWLDRPTADVLAFVARRIESDPILLLAAIRDGYPSALSEAGLPEHKVVGLDDSTAEALLDAAAPDLPVAMRIRVLREAAGNPLAILELPAAIGRRQDEQLVAGGLPLAARPDRVRDRRDLRLDPQRQHHLRRRRPRDLRRVHRLDFNRLRRSSADGAVPIASIFLDVLNVFLLVLELFGGRRD